VGAVRRQAQARRLGQKLLRLGLARSGRSRFPSCSSPCSWSGGIYYRSHQSKRLTDKDTDCSRRFRQQHGRCGVRRHTEDGAHRFPAAIAFPECALRQRSSQDLATDDPSSQHETHARVARELCQRAGSKAYIAGSIGSLGSQYVLGLKAVNCQSGDTLAEEQVTAASKEKVLDALGEAASKLRGELGESLATVQKFDVPLAEATTSSLDALKAYSLGQKAVNEKGPAAGLPYHQRAIELDPNFAIGYWS
jgi:hypothetical protein